VGGEGVVSWNGCQTGGVEDLGWISGCVVVGHPDKICYESLFSTAAPKGEPQLL